MRFLFCFAIAFVSDAGLAFANQGKDDTAPVVLIRSGETREVTLAGTCKRITNQAPLAIGIEVGPSSRWPEMFDASSGQQPKAFEGQIRIAKCKE